MEELLYEDITFDIRGACFWVWKEFRGAFKEKVIDRALTIELKRRGRKVEDQKRLNITYQGIKVGTYIPDKVVDDKILVELKCKQFLTQEDIDQFWKYLKGSKYKLGLLINFGPKNLEIKRVIYDTARDATYPRLAQRVRSAFSSADKGFTLMEVVVATTIFAMVAASMMALFNYVLKINRRAEALRQSTQAVRNFVEYVVKAVRNGQIDYSVNHVNLQVQAPVDPCPKPIPDVYADHDGSDTYLLKENRLGILTNEGERLCIFLGSDANGNWAGLGSYSGQTLVLKKEGGSNEVLTPPNVRLENLVFYIRPLRDPYSSAGVNGLARFQPLVTIIMKLSTILPTGEKQEMYYQTSISSDKYDIPNN